jgi:transposase
MKKSSTKQVVVMGKDLAKNVFQLHGLDAEGHVVIRRQLKRHQMFSYFARLPACLIGMESCGGAHYWSRVLSLTGHTVRLMAPVL